MTRQIGLGCENWDIAVYIQNRPNFADLSKLDALRPLANGELHAIGVACGNGWRKVFNVYAKLIQALHESGIKRLQDIERWQSYRDNTLLQRGSQTALLFSPPDVSQTKAISLLKRAQRVPASFHIICGKQYAKHLQGLNEAQQPFSLHWLNQDFAIDPTHNLVVCPYFDYRQLSNIKIDQLVDIIHTHLSVAE